MSTWKLTRKAQADFSDIVLYTTDHWGEEKAERYAALLLEGLDLLAERPGIGRSCHDLSPRLRRFEQGSHVIFYRLEKDRILVSRILHQRMLPTHSQFLGTQSPA